MAGVAEELLVFLRANTRDFETKMTAAGKQVEQFGTKSSSALGKFASVGGASLAIAAAGATLVGVASIKAADDFEKSHARLENAVKRAGLAFDAEAGKIDAQKSSMEKLGFTYAETEDSLSRLVTGTGSVTKATRDQAIAADIAAARGISLTQATDLLVKVESGRYTQLGRLGIATKEQIAGFKDSGQAVDFLAGKYKGSASAAADTFGGKVKVLKTTLTDIAVTIGLKLIPIIESLASGLADTIHWFEENKAVAYALGGVIAAVLVPAMLTFIALKVQAFIETIVGGFKAMGTAAEFIGAKLGITATEMEATGTAAEAAGAQVEAAGAQAEAGGAGFQTAGAEATAAAGEFEAAGAAATAAGGEFAAAGGGIAAAGAAGTSASGGLAAAGEGAAAGGAGLATLASSATLVLGPLAAVQVISGGALTDFSDRSDHAAAAAKGWAESVVASTTQATGSYAKVDELYKKTSASAEELAKKHQELLSSLGDGTWREHGKTIDEVQKKILEAGNAAQDAKGKQEALGNAINAAKVAATGAALAHQATTGAINAERGSVFGLAAALNGLQDKDIQVRVHLFGVEAALATAQAFASIKNALGLATGGPVPGTPGQAVPIIAHGGEYVLDAGTVAAIKSGSASRGALTGTSAGGDTGGNTYQITVNTLTGGADTGRHIVNAVQDYERNNGKGWRN